MKRSDYETLERYMLDCMTDSAHDSEHIYRVLFVALDIARFEEGVDADVLIAACLLHDIGRREQFENPSLKHALVGAEKARKFLLAQGFDQNFADRVASCIAKHSYRRNDPPSAIEEKILFDADKIDVAGALGIARTLIYAGIVGEPLYSLDPAGNVSRGEAGEPPSFFREYRFKLEKLCDRFFTARGREIAAQRRNAAASFCESLYEEVRTARGSGKALLQDRLE